MKILPIAVAMSCLLVLNACSSVERIDGQMTAPVADSSCHVTVYQTRAQATKKGDIEELCIINGTSSMSFVHTVAVAIEKHKGKACACGATDVYVESRRETGWDMATVTMVAFRYIDKAQRASVK